jgi:repressor LexA
MQGIGIMDSDFVIVKQQQFADDGNIVIALIDGEATVKRFKKGKNKVLLLPENPNYKPIELTEDFLILGKVIKLFRDYE